MTDTIYIFTVAKQGVFGNSGLVYFFKRFYEKDACENNATHVVSSTSNIMVSLFSLGSASLHMTSILRHPQ